MKKWMLVLTVLSVAVCRADYVDEVMADSPDAYYRFEEPLGSVQMQDSSGNGHDSVAVSNVTFERNGIIGWSGGFATNGSVRLDFNRSPAAGDFSIECLVHFMDLALRCTLVSQLDDPGAGRPILYQEDGKIKSLLGATETVAETPLTTNQWYHLVLTSDSANDEVKIYIDGRVAAEQTVTADASDGAWVLGTGETPDDGHRGQLDEVAVYPFCLEKERILTHFRHLHGLHPVFYAATNGTSVVPYSSWETAATNVMDAVRVAQKNPRSKLMIGEGDFYMNEPFITDSTNICIIQGVRGGDGASEWYSKTKIIPSVMEDNSYHNFHRIGFTSVRDIIFGYDAPAGGGLIFYFMSGERCLFKVPPFDFDLLPGWQTFINQSTFKDCSFALLDSTNANAGAVEIDHSVFDDCGFFNLGRETVFLDRSVVRSTSSIYRNCLFSYCFEFNCGRFSTGYDRFFNTTFLQHHTMSKTETLFINTTDPLVFLKHPYYTDVTGNLVFLEHDGISDVDGDGVPDDVESSLGRSPVMDQEALIESLYVQGKARGVAAVTNTPSAYGLYSSDSILELGRGGIMSCVSAGQAHLNLQLEQCTNLVDGVWTNVGSAVDWQADVPEGKAFYRVKGSE